MKFGQNQKFELKNLSCGLFQILEILVLAMANDEKVNITVTSS
jgi:hypothetical protein